MPNFSCHRSTIFWCLQPLEVKCCLHWSRCHFLRRGSLGWSDGHVGLFENSSPCCQPLRFVVSSFCHICQKLWKCPKLEPQCFSISHFPQELKHNHCMHRRMRKTTSNGKVGRGMELTGGQWLVWMWCYLWRSEAGHQTWQWETVYNWI